MVAFWDGEAHRQNISTSADSWEQAARASDGCPAKK